MRKHTTQSGMVIADARPKAQGRKAAPATPTGLKSVVLRLARKKRDAVRGLAKETRIPYSVLLREAIEDMLVKRNCLKRSGE